MTLRHFALVSLVAATLATGCEAEGGDTVGPRGATVVSEDGRLALEIPEGALEHEVEIRIAIEQGEGDMMSAGYVIEPAGIAFAAPVELTYELDAEDMDAVGPEGIAVASWRGDGWSNLADPELDMVDATLSASLLYTSTVAVMQR